MPEKPVSETAHESPNWILASLPAVLSTKPAAASDWHWQPAHQPPSPTSSNPCSSCCSTSAPICAYHSPHLAKKTCCPHVSPPNTLHDSKNSSITSQINSSHCPASSCREAPRLLPSSIWHAQSAAAQKSTHSDCTSSTPSTPVCSSHSTGCQTCCSSWLALPTVTD